MLVVIAHPDDEVFCSGLLCALADRGDSLTLACFTRGEGGAQGAEEVGELAAKRSAELEASAKVLGVEEVRYLDYIDPMPRRGTAHEPQFEAPTLFADINELIESVAPDLIITHGSSGEYWHAAHILLHDFVCKAASRSGAIPVATFNAFNAAHPLQEIVNEDDRSTFRLGGRRYRERREEALRCHASQLSVFEHFSNGNVGDFVEMTSEERYRLL